MFHNLLLLGKGGKVVYLGPTSEVMNYFNNLGFKCPMHVNPSDFYLDVMNGVHSREGHPSFNPEHLTSLWEEHCKQQSKDSVPNSSRSGSTDKSLRKLESRKRTAWFFTQFWICLKRSIIQLIRNRFILFIDLSAVFITGYSLGCKYTVLINVSQNLQLDENIVIFRTREYIGPQPAYLAELCPGPLKLFCLLPQKDDVFNFTVLGICGICAPGLMAALAVFGDDKVVFTRESTSGLSTLSYYIGKLLSQLLLVSSSPLVYLIIFYALINPRGSIYQYYLILYGTYFAASGLGYVVNIMFDADNSKLVSVILTVIMQMFCGAFPTVREFNDMGYPLRMIPWFSYMRWGFEALYILEVETYNDIYDLDISYKMYGFKKSRYWKCIGIIFSMGVAFRILGYFFLLLEKPTSYPAKLIRWTKSVTVEMLSQIKKKIFYRTGE
jgi:hypothetical protein